MAGRAPARRPGTGGSRGTLTRLHVAGIHAAMTTREVTAHAAESVRAHPHSWSPATSGALGIEGPGRDGISDPGDLRIPVHQVSEERALQFALVTSE